MNINRNERKLQKYIVVKNENETGVTKRKEFIK